MIDPLPTSACPDCGAPLPPEQSLCPACLMRQALASRTVARDCDKAPHLPPPTPEEIADRFPGYEILGCLGRGVMGAVYKARQKSLNRLVAIKILAPERVGGGRFAERFTIEAELLAKLGHPHIVTIHDFGETGGLFYLVMEFIDVRIDEIVLQALQKNPELRYQQASVMRTRLETIAEPQTTTVKFRDKALHWFIHLVWAACASGLVALAIMFVSEILTKDRGNLDQSLMTWEDVYGPVIMVLLGGGLLALPIREFRFSSPRVWIGAVFATASITAIAHVLAAPVEDTAFHAENFIVAVGICAFGTSLCGFAAVFGKRKLANQISEISKADTKTHADPFAIKSLILGILSMVLWPLGFVPAIVLGHFSRSRTRRNPQLGGRGFATAGLALGYFFLIASIVLTTASVMIFNNFENARKDAFRETKDMRLAAAPKLEVDLRGQDVTDEILAELAANKNLKRLNLYSSSISDEGLRHLSSLHQIEQLGLAGTGVTDDGVRHLITLNRLEELHLGWTKISDESLKILAMLPSLRELSVLQTNVTADGLREFQKARPEVQVIVVSQRRPPAMTIPEAGRPDPGIVELGNAILKQEEKLEESKRRLEAASDPQDQEYLDEKRNFQAQQALLDFMNEKWREEAEGLELWKSPDTSEKVLRVTIRKPKGEAGKELVCLVEGEEVDFEELGEHLKSIIERDQPAAVEIACEPEVIMKRVMTVVGTVKEAGVDDVRFIVLSPDDETFLIHLKHARPGQVVAEFQEKLAERFHATIKDESTVEITTPRSQSERARQIAAELDIPGREEK